MDVTCNTAGAVASFAVYGVRFSAYSHTYLTRLLAAGYRPTCLLVIDDSLRNQAASRTLMDFGTQQYPLSETAWDRSPNPHCLLALAEQHGIPYLAVADFDGPYLHHYLKSKSLSVIVATDGPIIRGPILYCARYGILSVHAASLPTFRGNWTTYFNLSHNQPLKVSAFLMQPWVDEGVILGLKSVPVSKGMDLTQINRAALHACIELAGETLTKMAGDTIAGRRQEPWEGETFRGKFQAGILQPAMPAEQQLELEDRLAAGLYGFYSETP